MSVQCICIFHHAFFLHCNKRVLENMATTVNLSSITSDVDELMCIQRNLLAVQSQR